MGNYMLKTYVTITNMVFPEKSVTIAYSEDNVSQIFPDNREPLSYDVIMGMVRRARIVCIEDFVVSPGRGTKLTGAMRTAVQSYYREYEDYVAQELDPDSWYVVVKKLYSVDRNT